MEIQFFCHAAFRLATRGGCQIYFDPVHLQGDPPIADLILLTHGHFNHCSPGDIKQVSGPHTRVIGPACVKNRLADHGISLHLLDAGQDLVVHGISIRAVEAYNTNKLNPAGEPIHPREKGHVGFVLEADGYRIYFAGDTDVVPADVDRDGPVDLAFVPVGGKYVMTPAEAAAALRQRPFRCAVPMHDSDGDEARRCAEAFRKLASSCDVLLINEGQVRYWAGGSSSRSGGPLSAAQAP